MRRILCKKGQGTVEYIVLVGLVIAAAIFAWNLFKPKLEKGVNQIGTSIENQTRPD